MAQLVGLIKSLYTGEGLRRKHKLHPFAQLDSPIENIVTVPRENMSDNVRLFEAPGNDTYSWYALFHNAPPLPYFCLIC